MRERHVFNAKREVASGSFAGRNLVRWHGSTTAAAAFGRGQRVTRDSKFGDVSPLGVVASGRMGSRRLSTLSARSIVLGYVVVGVLWMSDRLAAQLFPNAGVLTLVLALKGWGFVAVTGGLSR